jgi:hypothetical protein
MTSASGAERYALFGLTILSDIPLGLPAPAEGAAPDVVIARGAIDVPGEHGPGYSEVEGGTLLWVDKVGRFLIRGGAEIVVEPSPSAPGRNVRLFLLGSAFGALLHQRGLMPLHANAVIIDGHAFAFCGHSGAGKSTMAAWFHDRGAPILADDVCVIGFDADGAPLAYPGVPRLRLWRQALEVSGRQAEDYHRSFDDVDKYDVPIAAGSRTDPAPLAAVYLLEKAPEGAEEATIARLTGVAAVETLVSNTYRGGYLQAIGGTGAHLATCVRLARSLPIFSAKRLWGFDTFDAEAQRLQDHARSQLQGAR